MDQARWWAADEGAYRYIQLQEEYIKDEQRFVGRGELGDIGVEADDMAGV